MSTAPAGRSARAARSGRSGRPGRSVLPALLAFIVQLLVLYAPSAGGGGAFFPHTDKVVHAAVFGLPVFLAVVAGVPARWVVPLMAGHAVLSEVIQAQLLPRRSGDPWDVVADLVGVGLGLAAAHLVARRRAVRTAASVGPDQPTVQEGPTGVR